LLNTGNIKQGGSVMKYVVNRHNLKPLPIILQVFELFFLPFDIIGAFYRGYSNGGRKHGFGNATVELRRRYCATYVYSWSIRNFILHVLGVTLMDPFGRSMITWYGVNGFAYRGGPRGGYIGSSETQYLHSLNPFVRRTIKTYIDHVISSGGKY
jgi:hypothetical protein